MINEYLDFLINFFLREFFIYLDSIYIIPGVSLIGFCIAVSILTVLVGAVLLRA